MPTITTLPSPPSTSDPANFSSKADAHILALQTFTTEVNAFGASLAGAGIITPTRDSFAVNATTTDLWNHSIVQDWTGTATVTNFPAAPAAGSQRISYPAAGTIITHGGNISVQGNATYTVAAGDELTITAITTTTFYVTIKRKDGLAIVIPVVTDKIQPITASVAANALTLTLNPTVLDFRSATLTSGTVNTRTISAAISLVISSGSTLGTVSAVQSRIVILAIDNAGTIELAAVNIAGGNDLSETGLITTVAEGGAGAADSANVIYSATARSNVPYRVVGYVESTQATSGTWATAPSTIQGYGGQALASMSSIGYGQTWQAVTRTVGTTYYNTTGKPICLSVYGICVTGSQGIIFTINGYSFSNTTYAPTINVFSTGAWVIIPPNQSYSWAVSTGTLTSIVTSELR